MYHTFFIHSSADGHLGCFQELDGVLCLLLNHLPSYRLPCAPYFMREAGNPVTSVLFPRRSLVTVWYWEVAAWDLEGSDFRREAAVLEAGAHWCESRCRSSGALQMALEHTCFHASDRDHWCLFHQYLQRPCKPLLSYAKVLIPLTNSVTVAFLS